MFRKPVTAFLLLLLAVPAVADVDTAWVRSYGLPDDVYDKSSALAVDACGNLYVTGEKGTEETRTDYTTVKYYPNGDTAWARRYDGPNGTFDLAYDLAVDGFGNVYVTGWSEGVGTYVDYATLKYDSSGNLLWVRRYDGPMNSLDGASAIALDNRGNIYVTGKSVGGSIAWDYATIKYHPNGDPAWIRRYRGPGYWSEASDIAVDDYGNVYVTGMSAATGGTDYDYATVKYDSLGNQLWVGRYNGTGNYRDMAHAVAVDESGNVYVTGQSWGSGFLYEYATVKYDSGGTELWARRYRGLGSGENVACAIGIDDFGNVCVTGESYQTGSQTDYGTVKYSPTGDSVWVRRFDRGDQLWDRPYAMAVGDYGDVYVTGMDRTVKYDSDGNQLWVGGWGGVDVAIDSSDNVYVTGWDAVSGKFRFVTVKYVQSGSGVDNQPGEAQGPLQFTLFQNHPNPFNQSTRIRFNLAKPGFVRLDVHDVVGRRVRTLVSKHLSAGYKSVLWDGKNDSEQEVASGIYFYRIRVGDFYEAKKLVLLK